MTSASMGLPVPSDEIPDSCVVYTPADLAAVMVQSIAPTAVGQTWLDPCVGQGAFTEALSRLSIDQSLIRAVDLSLASAHQDRLARTLRGVDFLQWCSSSDERFDRIVANPPYFSLSRAETRVKTSALAVEAHGLRLSAGGNIWLAFLLGSLKLLRPGGALCFVLPASWDYAQYASGLRKVLPTLFSEIEVHRSHRPLFPDVQEGCVVLVCRGYQPHAVASGVVRRFEYADRAQLIQGITNSTRRRSKEQDDDLVGTHLPNLATVRLRDVVDLRLGGVTGDANFFLLSEPQRLDLGLPKAALRPILSRAQHLHCGRASAAEWTMLAQKGERVWLFDPPPHIVDHPAVSEYLRLPTSAGGCKRGFKVATRAPWYRTPLPSLVDGFMSGMSGHGPWVVFREMPRLNATNTLYTVRFRQRSTGDFRAAVAMWLLTSYVQPQLRRIGRRYADGLIKYEPGELGSIKLCLPKRVRGARGAYFAALDLLLSGERGRSRRIADDWFSV